MTQEQEKLLSKLIVISKVDSSVAQIEAQQKALENKIATESDELKKLKNLSEEKTLQFADTRKKYEREEKRLKEEQEGLIARRKALSSFSDYKTQQAAEREIEQASKQLSSQEESLITLLEQVEALEQEAGDLNKQFEEQAASFETLKQESNEELAALEERRREKEEERHLLAQDIDAKALQQYERIHERYPQDAVVALDKVTCTGCFMQVGPQMTVQVARGEQLVRCRGCGRILYLDEGASEE